MESSQREAIGRAEAARLEVRPEVHPDDFIFQFVLRAPCFQSDEAAAIRYYFTDGGESARKLLSLLRDVCGYDGTRTVRLLEFAAGYGCVTRHLAKEIPFLDVTACDIHPQAVRFLQDSLGTEAALSASRPEDLSFDRPFDVVFALSFFSHMPKTTFARWLSRLASFVAPGGYLIFTTHGVESKKMLSNGPYDEEGFSFLPSSEQKDLNTSEYGVTATLPHFVLRQIFREADCRPVFFREGFWWKHQDVYVVRREKYESLPAIDGTPTESSSPALLARSLEEKDQRIHELSSHLSELYGSRAFIVFQLLRRIRSTFVPYGGRWEKIVRAAWDRLAGTREGWPPRNSVAPAVPTPQKSEPHSVRELAEGMTDEGYWQLMVKSLDTPVISGVKMPGFPSEEIQRNFVGFSREDALKEGFTFYRCIKEYGKRLGVPIGERTRVLDFGCGWGRICRFFFKDVDGENVFGVDVDPTMIAFCEAEMTCGRYRTVEPEPPMSFFDNDSLDVIFAYSVFSHLAESVAGKWIAEFARVLRPGGILLATTQPRAFLDVCASLQGKTEDWDHLWHRGLARSFLPIEKSKADYDAGKFLYSGTGGGEYRDKSFYGEALIPKGYIQREYSAFLRFRDFVDDPARLNQALFVMQKAK